MPTRLKKISSMISKYKYSRSKRPTRAFFTPFFIMYNRNIEHFYIHIPFCRQKCPYCKFALTPVFDAVKKKRYIGHLKKEIRSFFQGQNISIDYPQDQKWSIYFGGGTPSVLSLTEVSEILHCFPNAGRREITFECNPEDITTEYVSWLFDLWINRISLGIQSINEITLKAIHRSSKQSIFEALESIGLVIASKNDEAIHLSRWESTELPRFTSFGSQWQKLWISLNIDFILGLPYSKFGETINDLQLLHTKYPFITHTSIYMLEEWLYPKDWKEHSITEKDMEHEYSEICRYLKDIGWNHYEISNWAKPWLECRHNQWYWNHTNYRGFGLSATSFVDGVRWENSASFRSYPSWKLEYKETLSDDQIELERMIHELRTFSLSWKWFDKKKLEKLEMDGYIEIDTNKILLTPAWIFRENFILSELLLEESS